MHLASMKPHFYTHSTCIYIQYVTDTFSELTISGDGESISYLILDTSITLSFFVRGNDSRVSDFSDVPDEDYRLSERHRVGIECLE